MERKVQYQPGKDHRDKTTDGNFTPFFPYFVYSH